LNNSARPQEHREISGRLESSGAKLSSSEPRAIG
jgi:hypothetical protein